MPFEQADMRASPLFFKRRLQNAMHDEIRVTADGRREMRVGGRGEREVAEVFLRISRLLERAQHQVGENALLGLARQPLGQTLVVPRRDAEVAGLEAFVGALVAFLAAGGVPTRDAKAPERRAVHSERVAERRRDFLELENFFRVGCLVNAVEGGDGAALEVGGYRLVRRQHEFFDDAVGDVPLRASNADHAAALVELDFGLRQIEINRAALIASEVEQPRELLHEPEVFSQLFVALSGRALARENVPHRRVRHALDAPNDRGD